MDPDGNLFQNILLLFFLILFNAFFAMSEIAIISLNDNKIKKMAQDGDKKASRILRLTEDPSRFLATIQVGVTLSGFLASAVAASTFADYIVYAMRNIPVTSATVHGVSVVVITIILSYFTLVLGELVPKRAAMQNYEKISFAVAPALSLFAAAGRPFVTFLSASANAVLRLFGIDPNHTPEEVTEEEIRMMIDVGGEHGSIEESEKEMLNNIFEFDDRTVDEMMAHRTEITAIEMGTPLEKIVETALSSGYSRIPVFEDDLDSIVGILYVKDLLALISSDADDAQFSLKNYMREPLYVLESNTCMAVLGEFKTKKIQMAIVVDEYGGTSGLVTMEDLLESIVGNIQDEYDDEEEEIFILGENRFLVDGLTPLEDVEKYFGLSFADEEFDTIGGYIVDQLGRIPSDNEHPGVIIGGYQFIVSEMDERRVAKLEVERMDSRPAECPAAD